MKKFNFGSQIKFGMTVLLFLLSFNLFSQTYHPTQIKLKYKGIDRFIDQHPDFQQKNYILGYHWATGYKLSQVLGMNQIHYQQPDQYFKWQPVYNDFAHHANLIINTPIISNQWQNFQLSRAKACVYEPTYKVDIAKPYENFIPRTYDTTRYCMGFKDIKGYISNSSTDLNYNRLQLFQDSLSNEIVLSNNWTANEYFTTITPLVIKINDTTSKTILNNVYQENLYENYDTLYIKQPKDTMFSVDWKGVNNYLNINLRRIDTTTSINNDTLLSIQLEYVTFRYDTIRKDTNGNYTWQIDSAGPRKRGYIRFDSIPVPNPDSTFSLPFGRGIVRKMKLKDSGSIKETIFITRSMLPKANATQKDITISAWFINNGLVAPPFNKNYGLSNFPIGDKSNTIDSLKVIVRFYDKTDLGIDWISINNRATRELSFGWLDTMITKKIQLSLDSHMTTTFTSKFVQPFRWYLNDEPTVMAEWYTRHYLTKLHGQIFTQEGGVAYPQFHLFCNPKENWMPQGSLPYWRTNPYIPYHAQRYQGKDTTNTKYLDFQRCNFKWQGNSCYYLGIPDDSTKLSKLLASNYETIVDNYYRFNSFKENNENPYNYQSISHLAGIAREEYESMHRPEVNQYLFNGKKWWGQMFPHGSFFRDFKDTSKLNNGIMEWYAKRTMTGEEFRYFINRTVLYGGKGFIVDGERNLESFYVIVTINGLDTLRDTISSNIVENFHHNQDVVDTLGLNSQSPWEFLENNQVGSDFADPNDPNDIIARHINYDTLSHFMGIDKKRIYIGRKSTRREFKKVSEFIKNNDSLLMRLQLIGLFTKGFRGFILHDNKVGDSIFTKFIKQNETKTRPLNRVRPYYEQDSKDPSNNTDIDSGFYDITILKEIAKQNIDSEFYLGILNKRTGPHLWLDSADCGKADSISFITTAELDSLCDSPDSTKWRKYYWKRLGTREITLFFNDSTYNPTTHYLKITEVENRDTTGFSTWNFWRKNKYENILDTKLYANQPLNVKLLPGDGKLLKVEKILRDSLTDSCDCDHILPQKYLEFKRRSTDNCLTLDFTLYPCPNIQADSFQLDITSVIPPCLKRFFHITVMKNDTLIPGSYLANLTGSATSAFMFYTDYKSGDKKIKLKYILCPDSTMGPITAPCTDQELTQLNLVAYFGNGYCGKSIETVTSINLENFNQDFNKFFQTEFNNFFIVPNPAVSYIDLSFETPLSINSKVYIVDEQGRILKERIITADSNEKLTIDVNNLSNGTYFIAVYDKDKLIKGKPFLIMK